MSASNPTTEKLYIFDTTLRDGEQSPGASMTRDEKLRIARALDKMRVDIIEAGFPSASDGDFESVQAVSKVVQHARVCGLARAIERDIDRAADAVAEAQAGRIHTFIATSPIHMQQKLCMSPDQVLEMAVKAVRRARNRVDDVEFSAEDAARSDIDFLCRVFEAVIDAGARTINIPDTVGYIMPDEFFAIVQSIVNRVPNIDKAIISVHCHNDLGCAVANSLSAVRAGARQVECTINGLGERAGNASLEETVMAIKTRADSFGVHTDVDTHQIVPTSQLVSMVTGFAVPPNKAIVGGNAFRHESGIHQDGIIKSRGTYEIMRAQDVGWETNLLVMGKHSGRSALRARLEELGVAIESDEALQIAFERFKSLADKKHEIYDQDLLMLMRGDEVDADEMQAQIESLSATCSLGDDPSVVKLSLRVGGQLEHAVAHGDGPVDATFKAIEQLLQTEARLAHYSVNAITSGADAQGEVMVQLEKAGRVVRGVGVDTDIVVASAKSYVDAANKLPQQMAVTHPQQGAI